MKLKKKEDSDDAEQLDGAHPDGDELFEIIRLALKKTDMVGCMLEDEDMALKYGLYKEHFYLVSQVLVFDKSSTSLNRFVKIHNPFNTRERIKNTDRYVQLEAKLKAFGMAATRDGEFWYVYKQIDFNCNTFAFYVVVTESI